MSSRHVFVLGYPSDVGGANTELWHTVKLWRRFGLEVSLLPTWQADPEWRARLDAVGCRTVACNADNLESVPGLAGGVVLSFCNTRFLAAADRFRRLGCRVVWVGCMNWLFPEERLHYRQFGPFTRHVFQSRYQHDQLVPQLRRFGFEESQGRIIRGAMDVGEIPFQPLPHCAGRGFCRRPHQPGRSRQVLPHAVEDLRADSPSDPVQVLGWRHDVEARLGQPPPWAECFPPAAGAAAPLLRTLHALVQANAAAVENWPRIGLEAMAAGVPLVVDANGGWPEMIRHGQTGYLCSDDDQFAYYAARLAYDEPHRLQLARQARRSADQ